MALYLDSANLEDAKQAASYGFVAGITTNPTLMAKESTKPLEQLEKLTGIFPGPVFYQLTAQDTEGLVKEGRAAMALARDKVVLKVPCTLAGLAAVAQLSKEVTCAMTAVFSAQQAWLATQAGARYVIPYINRTSRLGGDPFELIGQMAEVLWSNGVKTELLAASIKSSEEALQTLEAGAQHLTLSLDLIKQMAEHEWSQQTIAEFGKAAPSPKAEKPKEKAAPQPQPEKPPLVTPVPEEQKHPAVDYNLLKSTQTPFSMLDYIVGKIELEELMAEVSRDDLKSYLAQRELDRLKEEDEINIRLEELKKKLGQ